MLACIACVGFSQTTLDSNHQKNGYIFGNVHHTIVPKSQGFIQELSAELYQKSGIKVYFDVLDTIAYPSLYPDKASRRHYEQERISTLQAPFVIIFLFLQEHKIELISSKDLHGFLGPKVLDSIYFDYMAALLPEKERDITPQRLSAILLNGYAQIAQTIADHYEFKLENGFDTNEEGVRLFVRVVLYIMLFILLGLFALAQFSRTKPKGSS